MPSWDWDYLWHFLGGAAIDAAVAVPCAVYLGWCWVGFPVAGLLGVFGYVRERYWQSHDHMTPHRWIEALAWGAGGLITAGVGFFLF